MIHFFCKIGSLGFFSNQPIGASLFQYFEPMNSTWMLFELDALKL